jgi:hypothetical protein
MKPRPALSLAAQVSVAALVLLGLVGGSLVVAHAGFETSPRRGGWSVWVPAPEAYVLAATMYLMGALGWLALIQARRLSLHWGAWGLILYAACAGALVVAFTPV